jgi:hypothetical protein
MPGVELEKPQLRKPIIPAGWLAVAGGRDSNAASQISDGAFSAATRSAFAVSEPALGGFVAP